MELVYTTITIMPKHKRLILKCVLSVTFAGKYETIVRNIMPSVLSCVQLMSAYCDISVRSYAIAGLGLCIKEAGVGNTII